MRVTSQSVSDVLSAFARDAQGFIEANPLLLVGLVSLAIIVFALTRPKVG